MTQDLRFVSFVWLEQNKIKIFYQNLSKKLNCWLPIYFKIKKTENHLNWNLSNHALKATETHTPFEIQEMKKKNFSSFLNDILNVDFSYQQKIKKILKQNQISQKYTFFQVVKGQKTESLKLCKSRSKCTQREQEYGVLTKVSWVWSGEWLVEFFKVISKIFFVYFSKGLVYM